VNSELLTVAQVAERLQVKPRTVEDLVRRGDLKSLFLGDGRIRRITVDALNRFVSERANAVAS
jgi:excisionase family DNA binding protein